MVYLLQETVQQFLKKLNIYLQYDHFKRNENLCPHKDLHSNI